jgi:hypothetical protein
MSVVPKSDLTISKSRFSGNAPGSVNVSYDNTEVIDSKINAQTLGKVQAYFTWVRMLKVRACLYQ